MLFRQSDDKTLQIDLNAMSYGQFLFMMESKTASFNPVSKIIE